MYTHTRECVHAGVYKSIINYWKGVGVARQETTKPTFLSIVKLKVSGHSAKMRAIGRILVVVCAISISCCNATDLFRAKRGVVPGNAASRPKGNCRNNDY